MKTIHLSGGGQPVGWHCGRRGVIFAAFAVSLVGAESSQGAEKKYHINVNVSLTEEGKKVPRPTPDAPAYYYPLLVGFTEWGAVVGGEKPPDLRKQVVPLVAKALAQEGYLVSVPERNTPPPSLLLRIRWGYLNPIALNSATGQAEPHGDRFVNRNEMVALVAGRLGAEVQEEALINLPTREARATMEEAREDRYFIIISAYDFATAYTEGKKKLLWQARISAASGSISSVADVFPALFTAAAPFFGREAMPPQRINVPVGRSGTVEIGEVTVQPEGLKPGTIPSEKNKETD